MNLRTAALRTAARRLAPAVAAGAVLGTVGAACIQATRPHFIHLEVLPPGSRSADPYVPPSTIKARADDRKWMAAHPVPARPGMTPALVTHDALSARCTVLSKTRGYCDSWAVTVITPARRLTITCGSQYTACTSKAYPPRAVPLRNSQPAGEASDARPDTGDYLYIPDSGTVTADHDVTVIRRHADPAAGRL